jgi:predicted nucleic acid-binding protein
MHKLGFTRADAEEVLDAAMDSVALLAPEFYAAKEAEARQRLHEGGQSDWPILAAALAGGGAIWSHDRDFFGVGVPVWSSRNMRFAAAA